MMIFLSLLYFFSESVLCLFLIEQRLRLLKQILLTAPPLHILTDQAGVL